MCRRLTPRAVDRSPRRTALRLLLGLAHRVLHRHPNYAQELADAFDYVIPIPLTAADAPAAPQQLLVAVREGLDIYDPTAPGGVGGLTEDWERSLRASLMDHAAELRALQVMRDCVRRSSRERSWAHGFGKPNSTGSSVWRLHCTGAAGAKQDDVGGILMI